MHQSCLDYSPKCVFGIRPIESSGTSKVLYRILIADQHKIKLILRNITDLMDKKIIFCILSSAVVN